MRQDGALGERRWQVLSDGGWGGSQGWRGRATLPPSLSSLTPTQANKNKHFSIWSVCKQLYCFIASSFSRLLFCFCNLEDNCFRFCNIFIIW